MRCLLGCLGFLIPRAILVAMWLSGYLDSAYESLLWPLLGFVFLPLTTIVYAWAINTHGEIDGLYTVAVTLAVLLDLGVIGGSNAARKKKGEGD